MARDGECRVSTILLFMVEKYGLGRGYLPFEYFGDLVFEFCGGYCMGLKNYLHDAPVLLL